jgi:DNA-binding SARP family transcriptional activator
VALLDALTLELLRTPQLIAADGTPRPLSRKDAALLALLALDGAAPPERAASLLWPDAAPAAARANLRQRRFRLARAAGSPVIDGDSTLTLAAGLRHALNDPAAALRADALALDGDLLDGMAFDDCPTFEQWLMLVRERWRVARAQALARIASEHEASGALALALQLAERLAREDPLSDHAHRRLMRLHHLRGDLGAALEVYRRFSTRLDAELGEYPDEETASFAAALRRGEVTGRIAPPMPATLRRPPRLIGRESAASALQKAWSARSSVVIEGAPGIGKSRLLHDAVAAHDPARVLWVPALSGDADRPYAVLVRALHRLWFDAAALRPGAQQALPGWARHELAALLPELGAGAERAEPLRLQRAVQAALLDLDLVAIDDAQQADIATLELLPALASPLAPTAPRWWLTGRAGELPAPVRAWLQASDGPRHLRLQPWSSGQVAELLADLDLADWQGPAAADRLHRHTGGLPLFLLEVLRELHGRPETDFGAMPAGDGVSRAVLGRAARLSDAARPLAHLAALSGRALDLDAAAALLGGRPMDWQAAFGELEAAHWLDPEGRMHDLVRQALAEALPSAERRWLHGRLAEWLGTRQGADGEQAPHWLAAGRPERAGPAFEAAALRARRASRPAEESVLWQQATQAWRQAGELDRAFNARIERLPSLIFAGGTAAALPEIEDMLATARTPFERVMALIEKAHETGHDGHHGAGVPAAREALALARAHRLPVQALRATRVLGNLLAQSDAAEEAIALLRPLRTAALRGGRREAQMYLNALSQALHRGSRMRACAEVVRAGLTMVVEDEDWREAVTLSGNLAVVLGGLGRFDEAWGAVEQALDCLALLGEGEGNIAAALALKAANVRREQGWLGQAIGGYARADALYRRVAQGAAWPASIGHALATAHLVRGDPAAAEAALLPLPPGMPAYLRSRRHQLLARLARAAGADPRPALTRALAEAGSDRYAALMARIESAELTPGTPPAHWQGLQADGEALEQDALAARAAWRGIQALLCEGHGTAAADAAARQLRRRALPTQLLPCHRLWIAHAALQAGGRVRQAATLLEQARQAHAAMRADLGTLSAPGLEAPPW